MSDHSLALPAPLSNPAELSVLVARLRQTLQEELVGNVHVRVEELLTDATAFQRSVVATAPNGGALEVIVDWEKSRGHVTFDLARSTTVSGPFSYLPLGLAFALAFLADWSPALLPEFRGLRVVSGAALGWVFGFLLLAALAAVNKRSRTPLPSSIEETMRAVVARFVDDERRAFTRARTKSGVDLATSSELELAPTGT